MRMAMFGLGRMGGNMARRLLRGGIEVVGLNRSFNVTQSLQREEGLIPAEDIDQALEQLPTPRIVWLMLPSGTVTETHIEALSQRLSAGDIVIDGGNTNYHESERRAQLLRQRQIHFIDVGTSGGVWGLQEGYCLMAGGSHEAVHQIQPILEVLAPAADRGWAHVGPHGAGHFTKMIHNGIEYGMMQAYAEGFALLEGKQDYQLDLAQLAELWRHGSVVRSWLLDLTADALQEDATLEEIAPYVSDSGEGRWTVQESVDQGVAAPVLSLALQMRFASQDQRGFGHRLLAKMRNAFGGHGMKKRD